MACSAHDRALPVLELGMLLTQMPCSVACKSAREANHVLQKMTLHAAHSSALDPSDPDEGHIYSIVRRDHTHCRTA